MCAATANAAGAARGAGAVTRAYEQRWTVDGLIGDFESWCEAWQASCEDAQIHPLTIVRYSDGAVGVFPDTYAEDAELEAETGTHAVGVPGAVSPRSRRQRATRGRRAPR